MVSTIRLLLVSALVSAPLASQGPLAANTRTEKAPAAEPVQPAELPRPALTPEMRGDIFMARKMYREAIDMYRQCPADSAVIANKIGIAYHQMLQLDLAKKQYERAIKLNKRYSEAINNLGTVWYAKRSYRKATGLYKKALKIAPESASIMSNLGTALFARKKYKEATQYYAQALALDPEVFERRSSHGVLLQERSVEERAKFHFYLSKTYASAGVLDRALLYMRKALEEGFKDRDRFVKDPEFAALQENAEFQTLLQTEFRVL
jgi:tetratricopeptide (TPR) repeat protein